MITETVIEARRGSRKLRLQELWEFRELLYFFAWRDVKVKYKQSLLGIAWMLLRPLVTVVVFTVLFGRLAKIPSDGTPYALFVFVGLFPWNYFAGALSASTTSVVSASSLVDKIYFPRLIIPVSASLSRLVDLAISMSILIALMAYYSVVPPLAIVWLPLLLLVVFLTALGPGILLGAANVKYRDVGHTIPFLLQVGFYMTPVIYPVTFVPERFRPLLYLNPMTGLVEAFRACILGSTAINIGGLAMSLAVSACCLVAGVCYFKAVERQFADVI